MLRDWTGIQDSDADFENEDMEKDEGGHSEIKDMTAKERECLERGCILFSQFFDSIYWIAEKLSANLSGMKLGIYVAVNNIEQAKKRIDAIPNKHPFEIRYQQKPGKIDWESCSKILDKTEKRRYLTQGWNKNGKVISRNT